MLKNLTGGAIINYGSTLPSASTSFDGALFYKTGADQGLYVFGFIQDANPDAIGDQSAQGWSIVQSPGLYVDIAGDTMTGDLRLATDGLTIFSNNFSATTLTSPMTFATNDQFKWTTSGVNAKDLMRLTNASALTLNVNSNWETVWHSGNDGVGSGLDADKLDGQDSTYFRNASNINTGTLDVSRLPFTPVQQGGGTGQLSNKVYIGWANGGQLYLQIDSTNFANVWPISITGNAATANYATSTGASTNSTNAVSSQYVRQDGSANGINMAFNTSSAGNGMPARVWGTNDTTNFATWNAYNPATFAVASATIASKASTLILGGGTGAGSTFNWSGQSGQPTWVWGGNDGTNMYVYNPSNFSVASAASLANFTVGGRSGTDFNAYRTSGMYAADGSPANAPNAYGSLIVASNSDVGLQIGGGYNSDNLFFRGWWSSGASFGPWRTVIHNGNIGSQSVSYANSAGSAGTAGTANALIANPTLSGTVTAGRYIGGGGSAAAPAFTLAESANDTGLYSGGDGYLNFATNGGYAGQIQPGGHLVMAGNVTAYSDVRLKENIELIPQALQKVQQLRGVTFDRIDTKERGTGVIAQEVQEILPEAVVESEGKLSVAYGNMVGLLIESIKELNAKVESLQSEIAELKK